MTYITAKDVIDAVEKVRPNAYSDEEKLKWINEVEGKIHDEIIKNSEIGKDNEFVTVSSPDTLLTADSRFSQMYVYYLLAKIDFFDNEPTKYNNDLAMFDSTYESFACWHIRTYVPQPCKGFYV